MRIAYLGPEGTFSHEALTIASAGVEAEPVAQPTLYAAIRAVEVGDCELALVPFENSIEGAVRQTLDALAFDAPRVTIVGEYDHSVRHSLIAREELELQRIEVVLSHPQPSAQCARFLREELPGAAVRPAGSSAEAVRLVAASPEPWAALAGEAAARIYGCRVLRSGVEDAPDNVTRFVWVAAEGVASLGEGPWRTSLVFSELGRDRPGALVEALAVFSDRGINLTRIESRPMRRGLGSYMFFADLEGGAGEDRVVEALEALGDVAGMVRLLGSYPARSLAPPRL